MASTGGNPNRPEFKREMVDATVPVGSSTKFLVEIRSSPEFNVAWFHNGFPVDNSDRYVLLRDKGIFCIQIHKVQPSDAGDWVCHVKNKHGKISCSATLQLQIPQVYKAPQFMTGLRGFLWDNGTLSLECDVIGVPLPTLRWYRDGKPLQPGSALTIRAFSKETKSCIGLFACEAENCMGSNTTFSRVYAKNFANYLKQFGHLRVGDSNSVVVSAKNKQQTQSKVSRKNCNNNIGKSSGETSVPPNSSTSGSDKQHQSDEDSGIADDAHHI